MAKVLFFLHVPRYIVAIVVSWLFYLAIGEWVISLLVKDFIPGIATLGIFMFLFTIIMGTASGGIGGLLGNSLEKIDRLGTTRPTRKNWKN